MTNACPQTPPTATHHAETRLADPQFDSAGAEALLAERYCFFSEAGYPIKRALALALQSTADVKRILRCSAGTA